MRIAIPIIIALLIGGGIYWYAQADGSDTTNTTPASTSSTEQSNAQTLADLLAAGDSVRCTFGLDDPSGVQSWTVYTDGTRVRGDYVVNSTDGSPLDGSIITDTENHYNWGQYQGEIVATKIALSARDAVSNTNQSSQTQTLDQEQSVDMDCQPWTVDASKFVPPSDVTFTDLSAVLEENSAAVQGAACLACDAMTDDVAKQECRAALGCE